ncbi:MAG: hypothetical protein ACKOQ7_00005, partial [Actinomycetota bacterium]
MVRPDGSVDDTFGGLGWMRGWTEITSLAVDESAQRIYILDRAGSTGPTIHALDLAGTPFASAPAGDAITLVAGASHLVALTATASGSTVSDADLANSRSLVQAPGAAPFESISDAAWFARGDTPGLAIADRTGGVVRRVALDGLATGANITLRPHPRAIPTPDVLFEAPSRVVTDASGNLFVATGDTAPHQVLRLASDGQSTRFVIHEGITAPPVLAISPTSTATAPPTAPVATAPRMGTTGTTSSGPISSGSTNPVSAGSGTQTGGGTVGVFSITTGETAKFKIESLTASTTARTAIEVAGWTGDDKGGMALSATKVFLRGDNNFTGANKTDLSGLSNAALNAAHDAPVSDLRSMKAYVFDLVGSTGNFTKLTELDQTTGSVPASPTVITLSSSIPYSGGEIYSGYGRVVYRHSDGTVYDIDLPSGQVYNRGTRSVTRNGTENFSGNYMSWGVAEFFDDELWLTVANGANIVRYQVGSSTQQTVLSTSGMSDIASFVVDPTNQRWYFHYESYSPAFAFGSDETLGFASAVISFTPAVTITPSATPTNADSMSFDVTFGEPVTGVATGDFALGGTSTGWAITGLVENSSTNYTLNVAQTGNGDGTLNVTLLAGSVNWTAGAITIPDSNTVSTNAVIDNTAPSVTSITGVSGTQNLKEFTYTVNMSE